MRNFTKHLLNAPDLLHRVGERTSGGRMVQWLAVGPSLPAGEPSWACLMHSAPTV